MIHLRGMSLKWVLVCLTLVALGGALESETCHHAAIGENGFTIPIGAPFILGGEDPTTVDRQLAQQAVDMLADQVPEALQEQFKDCVKKPIEAAKDGKVNTRALGEALAGCALSFLPEAAQVVTKVAECQEVAGSLATAFLWHACFDEPPTIRGGILPSTGKPVFKRSDTGEEFIDSEIAYTYDQAHTLFYYEVEDEPLKHKFVPFKVTQLVLPIGWKEISPPPNLTIQACILNINQVHYTDYFYVSVLGQVLDPFRPPSAPVPLGEGAGWYREFTHDIELALPLVIFRGGSLIEPCDIMLSLDKHKLFGAGEVLSTSDDWLWTCRRIVHVALQQDSLQLLGDYKQFYRLKVEPREAFTRGGDAIPQLDPAPSPPNPCLMAAGADQLWYEAGTSIQLRAPEQFDSRAFTQWEIRMLDFTTDPPAERNFTVQEREVSLKELAKARGPVIARAWFGSSTVTLDTNLCSLLGAICQEQAVADLELFKFDGQGIQVREIPKTLQAGVGITYQLSISPAVESYLREAKGLEIVFEGWDDNGDGRVDLTERTRDITVTGPARYKALFKLARPALTLKLRAICGRDTPQVGQELTVKVLAAPPTLEFRTPTDCTYALNTTVQVQALDLQLVACHQFGAPIPVFFSHWEIDGHPQPTGRTKVNLTMTRDTTAKAVYSMTPYAKLETGRKEYQPGELVTIRFHNGCQVPLTLRSSAPWVIKDSQGRVIFGPVALPVITGVQPGEIKSWTWDQRDNDRKQVPPGTYTVELETMDAGTYRTSFEIKALAQVKLDVRAVAQIQLGPIKLRVEITVPVLVNGNSMITPVGLQLDKGKPVTLTPQQQVTVLLPVGPRTLYFRQWECQPQGDSLQVSRNATISFTLTRETVCTVVYEEE